MSISFLEKAAAWAGGFAVVFTALAWYFSSALGRAKDAQLEVFQQQSATEIANANARSADAHKTAAIAEQGTAKALSDAAAATERTQRFELATEEQRERAARAERDLLELKARIRPRQLSSEHRAQLVADLRQSGSAGTVHVLCVDAEGCAYADQLRGAMSDAGWKVEAGGTMGGWTGFGITIVVGDSRATPPYATALMRVLRSIGLEVSIIADDELATGTDVVLVVADRR